MSKKQNPFKIFNASTTGNLSGKYKKTWVEESIDVEQEENKNLSIAHTKRYIGVSVTAKKIRLMGILIFLAISGIFIKVFYLQVIKGLNYRDLAEGNRIRLRPIAAERGIIYDRFNNQLVQNIPSFSLVIVPQDLPHEADKRKEIISRAAVMSGTPPEEIEKIIDKYKNYSYDSLVIKENLDYETALKLYIENTNLPGILVEKGSQRHYLLNTPTTTVLSGAATLSFSHLLGYLGKLNDSEMKTLEKEGYLPSDNLGKVGLEKMYEFYLRGTYGRKKIEVNALGKEQNVLAVEAPAPGKNLVLTIDQEAQREMEYLVRNAANTLHRRKIAAIALNPANGEIMALVSWPAFNNNDFAGGISKKIYNQYATDLDNPLFNRAISGAYPPGSTLKTVVSVAALQEKIITKDTTVNSVGGITVGGYLFKDWKTGGHGITNVYKALAWSVNTFFYYIGGGYNNFPGLGIDRLVRYFSLFNLGKKTGIDLPGEQTGFVPTKEWKKLIKGEGWFVGDTYNVAIGQGATLVTPLQDAVWTAAIANGGTLIQPHMGYKIIDPVKKTSSSIPFAHQKIEGVSASALTTVREGMRSCVLTGSCRLLSSLSFTSGAKTGTAQWSHAHPTHAWFTAFAPFNNPQIVVTVLIEEGGEGGDVAEPIAKKFLEWWGKKYLTHD